MLNDDFYYSFSKEAQNEIYEYIKNLQPYGKIEDVVTLNSSESPIFQKEVDEIREQLETSQKIVIVRPFIDLGKKYSIQEQRIISWLIGNVLGEPLIQNESGDKVICVYDRNRNHSIAQGARYHQTKEGGSIHTDNVNVPFHWEYMILACISPAMVGGENILVNAQNVYEILKESYPDVLTTLEKNFIWEKRGIADATYEAPIITYKENGEPLFRHLRPYMESAHKKRGQPLTSEQIYAIDVLDAIIEYSDNQYRHTFTAGEILITYDSQVLHGRTSFSDAWDALAINDWIKDPNKPLKRTMDRIWIKKK